MRNGIFTLIFALVLSVFTEAAFATVPPTLTLQNQFGETSINHVMGGSFIDNNQVAANSILSNLTGSSALPVANTYSAVSAKLLPTMLLTGYSAGGGTCAGTDTVIQCLQKLGGNVAAHQANSTAVDVAGLVTDFNALLAKLQAAHLMQ